MKKKKKEFKVFGITILKTCKFSYLKYLSIFNRLLFVSRKKVNINNIYIKYILTIKILGLQIYSKKIKCDKIQYFLFNKLIKENKNKKISNDYYKILNSDCVFIFRSNIGEMILSLTYIVNYLIKKNNTLKPLFIITQKKQLEILSLFLINFDYMYFNQSKFLVYLLKENDIKFYLFFSQKYYNESILTNRDYFSFMLDEIDINKDDLYICNPILNLENNSLLNKVKNSNLNLNNFIMILPEANSMSSYSNKFWTSLILKLKEQGYDIFMNITNTYKYHLQDKVKCHIFNVSIQELYELSKYAKCIVSLRSGILELLLFSNKKLMVLYNDSVLIKNLKVELNSSEFLEKFSLLKLPHTKKDLLKEYDTFNFSPFELVNNIINNIKA